MPLLMVLLGLVLVQSVLAGGRFVDFDLQGNIQSTFNSKQYLGQTYLDDTDPVLIAHRAARAQELVDRQQRANTKNQCRGNLQIMPPNTAVTRAEINNILCALGIE